MNKMFGFMFVIRQLGQTRFVSADNDWALEAENRCVMLKVVGYVPCMLASLESDTLARAACILATNELLKYGAVVFDKDGVVQGE